MAEILVSGYYGFNNAGDEAILAGMLRALRDLVPDLAVTVISGKAAHTRSLHSVEAVSRGDVKQIWRALGRADLMISGGGSLLQDVTSSRSLTYYLGLVAMARMRLRPVVFYAQGVGPVTRPLGRTLIPAIVNTVNLITVRDQESAETLRRLGVRLPPVTVTADAALALGPADPEWGAKLLAEYRVDLGRPVIGVSVRPWKQGDRSWEPGLARALDRLARETGGQVVFLPMQQPHDVSAAREVAGRMEEPAVLVRGNQTYNHLHAMVARCDLLIGMRYHALVFAAMNGVPLVGISYDPKNDSFLRQIGERAAGSTHHLDPEAVVAAARRALEDAPAVRRRLQERMAELTPLSRKNAELVVDLLRQRGSL
ncbi:MAG TPA: polysaccharide pyruvyl transferase CsaB [Symbiobacteriaceae bacterium]